MDMYRFKNAYIKNQMKKCKKQDAVSEASISRSLKKNTHPKTAN